MMLLDIAAARAAGLQGWWSVCWMKMDGYPKAKLRQLVEAAGPLWRHFPPGHRSLLRLAAGSRDDRRGGLRAHSELRPCADRAGGARNLQAMHQALAGRASLMPGAGVNADNVRTIIEFTGVNEVHMSGMGWAAAWCPMV